MLLGEPEVSNYRVPLAQENVGKFQISMQEFVLPHFNEPAHNVPQKFSGLLFTASAFFLQPFTQIPLVAILSDDVAVGGFPNNIVTLENVGMVEGCQGLYLAVEHFPTDSVLDSFHVDGFDSNYLV